MTRRGLFIGINAYPEDLGPLSSCVNDAVSMQAVCIRFGLLDAAETTLMTAPPTETSTLPTRAAILDWLLPLYDTDRPIDRLIVYLSGHGLSLRLGREADTLRTVFAPAGLRRLRNSGSDLIDLDELIGRFRRRGARDQIWIIDACRNTVEPRLDVATIGWDRPPPNDPREAKENAQAAIFAVAPLAKAVADRNGHGRLTRYLLEGLSCEGNASWGAAADYDEASDGWIISCSSLVRYARRRIGERLAVGDWRRDYELPQLRVGEEASQPLRPVGIIADRAINVAILPPDAAARISVQISARRRVLAAWPPLTVDQPVQLAPEVYRFTATVLDSAGKPVPPPFQSTFDVREYDRVELTVPPPDQGLMADARGTRQLGAGRQLGLLNALTSDHEFKITFAETRRVLAETAADLLHDAACVAQTVPQVSKRVMRSGRRQGQATVVVRAPDPASSIRLVRLSGPERQEVSPEQVTSVKPGIWRLELCVGAEIVSFSTHDFQAGVNYAVSPRTTITPAMAALLREETWRTKDGEMPLAVSLGDTIGPMQGAILPTLLPLAALRAFDSQGVLPAALAAIATETGPLQDDETIVALALEGEWPEPARKSVANRLLAHGAARRVWTDSNHHVAIVAVPTPASGGDLVLPLHGLGTLLAPVLGPNECRVVVALTLWPDRAPDVALALVPLPDTMRQAAHAARARAVLARMLEPGGQRGKGGFACALAAGMANDPILSALAWWWGRRRAGSPNEAKEAQEAARPGLSGRFVGLPDARVINALESAKPDAALDSLLDDSSLGAPVLADSVAALARRALARGAAQHWSAKRFQHLGDAVYSVVFNPSQREGERP